MRHFPFVRTFVSFRFIFVPSPSFARLRTLAAVLGILVMCTNEISMPMCHSQNYTARWVHVCKNAETRFHSSKCRFLCVFLNERIVAVSYASWAHFIREMLAATLCASIQFFVGARMHMSATSSSCIAEADAGQRATKSDSAGATERGRERGWRGRERPHSLLSILAIVVVFALSAHCIRAHIRHRASSIHIKRNEMKFWVNCR